MREIPRRMRESVWPSIIHPEGPGFAALGCWLRCQHMPREPGMHGDPVMLCADSFRTNSVFSWLLMVVLHGCSLLLEFCVLLFLVATLSYPAWERGVSCHSQLIPQPAAAAGNWGAAEQRFGHHGRRKGIVRGQVSIRIGLHVVYQGLSSYVCV